MHHPVRNTPIKIGFDAKRYYNNRTGLGNYSRWLINGLQSIEDLDMHLYHPSPVSGGEHRVRGPKGPLKKASFAWRSRYITRDLDRDGIEVYHGLSNEIPFGIHRRKTRSVVTIHDLINLRYPENYRRIDRSIYYRKLRYAQRRADIIIAPSEQTKRDIVHFFGTAEERIKVIPLSIPKVPTVFGEGREKDYILCVSSFTSRKNLLRLLEAYRNLNLTDVDLVITGSSGETLDGVRRMAQQINGVHLVVDSSVQKIHDLYHHALFCVYPSLFEGFGLPVLEAFAHNKVVATGNVSSMPEVGGNAAHYFDPTSIASMAEAMRHLLDPESRKQLEENIPERMTHFTSEDLIAQYADVYRALAWT